MQGCERLTRLLIDANCPTFANMLNGQVNLRDAIRRKIDFESNGKAYKLVEKPAVLIVRSASRDSVSAGGS